LLTYHIHMNIHVYYAHEHVVYHGLQS